METTELALTRSHFTRPSLEIIDLSTLSVALGLWTDVRTGIPNIRLHVCLSHFTRSRWLHSLAKASLVTPSQPLVRYIAPSPRFLCTPRGYLVRPCTNYPQWCKVVPLSCARLFAWVTRSFVPSGSSRTTQRVACSSVARLESTDSHSLPHHYALGNITHSLVPNAVLSCSELTQLGGFR